jgi:hypothetical protein
MKYILVSLLIILLFINYSYCRPIISNVNLEDNKPTVVNKYITTKYITINITSKNITKNITINITSKNNTAKNITKNITINIISKNRKYVNTFTTTSTNTFTTTFTSNIYNISNIINISNKIYINNTTHSVPIIEIENITAASIPKNNSTNSKSNSRTDSIISSCVAIGCLMLFIISLIFCRCTPGQKCYIDKTLC